MPKILRWILLIAAIPLIITGIAVLAIYIASEKDLGKNYKVEVSTLTLPTDPAALERGRRLGRALAKCVVCHGDDMGGRVIYDNVYLGTIAAPNLTTGKGGIGPELAIADYVRATLHGVGRDHEPLIYMTSRWYTALQDSDLAAIIAWILSLPPVDREIPKVSVGLGSRWLFLKNRFPDLDHARYIDHQAPRPRPLASGVNASYGKYLVDVSSCRGCHGEDLAGHPDLAYSRGAPALVQGGVFDRYSSADFIRAMRTGFTPAGYQINDSYMSWKRIGELNDDELIAMWTYLKSLPPRPPAGSAGGGVSQ